MVSVGLVDGTTVADAMIPGEHKIIFPFLPAADVEGAISDALLLGNIELAVALCIKEGKMADAIILAMSGGPELIAKTQTKYFEVSYARVFVRKREGSGKF